MVGRCFSFHELEKALIYSGTLLSEVRVETKIQMAH